MAQAGSNYEKNGGPKSRWTVPLRDSPTKFLTSSFFFIIEPVWGTDQWVKIFSILAKISPSYSNFSIFPGYHTPASRSPGDHTLASQSPRGIIPRRINFPGVLYPSESIKNAPKHDTPRFDTPASQSPRGTIPRQVNFCSTHSSVAQADLNKEKNGGRISRFTIPLKTN